MQLNDFHTKREAILAGIGYGWLPEYLDSRSSRAFASPAAAATTSSRTSSGARSTTSGEPRGSWSSRFVERQASF